MWRIRWGKFGTPLEVGSAKATISFYWEEWGIHHKKGNPTQGVGVGGRGKQR